MSDPQQGSVAYLMERTQRRLMQMVGAGVQSTEDTIIEHLTSAFNMIFDEYWWDEYTVWKDTELDGETGTPTVDFSLDPNPLIKFRDIRHVIPDLSKIPLRKLPDLFIPSNAIGDRAEYFISYPERPEKVFRVVPYSATGTLHVRYRTRPSRINIDTILRVDEEYLVAAASYLYLADDGTNPGATQIAGDRLQQTQRNVRSYMHNNVPLEGVSPGPVNYWWASS